MPVVLFQPAARKACYNAAMHDALVVLSVMRSCIMVFSQAKKPPCALQCMAAFFVYLSLCLTGRELNHATARSMCIHGRIKRADMKALLVIGVLKSLTKSK